MLSKGSIYTYTKHIGSHLFSSSPYLVDFKTAKFYIRPRTHDLYTIDKTYVQQEYTPTILPNGYRVETILDLGANIGDFSVWACQKYKPKKLVAVEIEPNNFDSLIRNIEANALTVCAIPMNVGIYSKNTNVGVKTHPIFKGSIDQLSEGEEKVVVAGKTLSAILDDASIEVVDFMKMDIEGSEKFVLTSENTPIFREHVRYAFIEAHPLLGYNPKDAETYFKDLGYKVRTRVAIHTKPTLMIEALNMHLL